MVKFSIPFFPPTTNTAFFVRHGRMHLSDKGKGFKKNVVAHLVQQHMKDLKFFKANVPYFLYLRFWFLRLENAGWEKGKCATRYKVFDATNRVKLTEDALKEAFGIDDSQFIAVATQKHECGPGMDEHFEAFVWDLEGERSPLDEFLRL